MSIADEILNYWISLLLKVRMFGWFFSDFYSLEMKHILLLNCVSRRFGLNDHIWGKGDVAQPRSFRL